MPQGRRRPRPADIRIVLAPLGVICLSALGAPSPRPASAADQPYAGVEILRGLFVSYDHGRDGRITPRELTAFTGLAFVPVDADGDGRVSREEFMAGDPGFASLAAPRDREQPFEAARRDVLAAWDRTGGRFPGRDRDAGQRRL